MFGTRSGYPSDVRDRSGLRFWSMRPRTEPVARRSDQASHWNPSPAKDLRDDRHGSSAGRPGDVQAHSLPRPHGRRAEVKTLETFGLAPKDERRGSGSQSDIPRPIPATLFAKYYVVTFSYKLLEQSCFLSRFVLMHKQDPPGSFGGILIFPPASQNMDFSHFYPSDTKSPIDTRVPIPTTLFPTSL